MSQDYQPTIFRAWLLCVSSAAVLTAGCAAGMLAERNANIAKMNDDAVARGQAAQHLKRTDLFVVAESAWLCPTAVQAQANVQCPDGRRLVRNQDIRVIGLEPQGEVWPAEQFDAAGQYKGFVLASTLDHKPNLGDLEAYLEKRDQQFPRSKRIPIAELTLTKLISKSSRVRRYKGRYFVTALPLSGVRGKKINDTGLTFTSTLPIEEGSREQGAVLFELANRKYADEANRGAKTFKCNATYCDSYFVVASFDGEIRDVVGAGGVVRRVPVFRITELADRFALYRAD